MSRRTLAARDVHLGDGRTLRVGILTSSKGTPERLILAVGAGRGRAWQEDPVAGLTLPASALSGLVEALGGLRDS